MEATELVLKTMREAGQPLNAGKIASMKESNGLRAVADDMNTIAAFLGARDVAELTQDGLGERYGWRRADVMALFGGSILAGGDVLADAMLPDLPCQLLQRQPGTLHAQGIQCRHAAGPAFCWRCLRHSAHLDRMGNLV